MAKSVDLLSGKIGRTLTKLALPIMATSMVQTAYNLTDMAWIGQIGSRAVTAVGAAGMYIWLSGGIVTLARMGGQIKVAHSLGEGNQAEAVEYAKGAIQMTVLLSILFALIVNVFTGSLIGFFGLNGQKVITEAQIYLRIAGGLIFFSFLNQTLTGVFTALGDSRTPFIANSIGLAVNMVLDPILILGFGPFPRMEAAGAAVATVAAQMVVTLVLVLCAGREQNLFPYMKIWNPARKDILIKIVRLGLPSSLQNLLYCGISMMLTRMVASWGDEAVAVQRVGGQVECVSWMAAEGFGSAMNAFTGQNFGARLMKRIRKSYLIAVCIIAIWGLITTSLLVFGAEPLFCIFIREETVIPLGIDYLRILGYGQMFMCVELMTVGSLQGLGRTLDCSVLTILLTASRIPLAILLTNTMLGLNGIWWALTVSSVLKGIIFFGYYLWVLRRLPE